MSLQGKRFLLIVNDMAWFWSHRLPLAREILAEGAELHLATNDAEGNPALEPLNITGHSLPKHTGSFNPFAQIMLFIDIFQTISIVRPDIIHAVTLRHAFFSGLAARIYGAPRVVFTVAGTGSLFTSNAPQIRAVRFFVIPLFRFAFGGKNRFVIFQNPDDARALVRAGAAKKENSGVIRGSGVDLVQFPYVPETPQDIPSVLFSSRLLKSKGISEFVHAARILKSKNIAARFLVAGDTAPGNHESVSRDDMNDWANEGVIEWLGHRTDMPDLMAASAIVTLPSYYGEGVPKVLLEAAATGRAIVTTDMPGCKETVEDGVTGILVPPKDGWALADALEKLLADPALRQSMGEKGRARIESNFTVEKVNARTLSVYRRLFAGE